MCDRVFEHLPAGQFREASTRGELRAMLGVEPIYDDAEWPDRSDYDCLCSCDVTATAERAGRTVTRDAFGEWDLQPANTPAQPAA